MALRNPQALLGTFIRAGVICLAAAARTCIAHSLPATPDIFAFTPLAGNLNATACVVGGFLESWDGTSLVFVNSFNTVVPGYLTAAVAHSIIS